MKQPKYDAMPRRRRNLSFILYLKNLLLEVNQRLDPRMNDKFIRVDFGKISNDSEIFVL